VARGADSLGPGLRSRFGRLRVGLVDQLSHPVGQRSASGRGTPEILRPINEQQPELFGEQRLREAGAVDGAEICLDHAISRRLQAIELGPLPQQREVFGARTQSHVEPIDPHQVAAIILQQIAQVAIAVHDDRVVAADRAVRHTVEVAHPVTGVFGRTAAEGGQDDGGLAGGRGRIDGGPGCHPGGYGGGPRPRPAGEAEKRSRSMQSSEVGGDAQPRRWSRRGITIVMRSPSVAAEINRGT